VDGCHNDWHTIQTQWTPRREEPEEESPEAKAQTLQQRVGDIYREEDSCRDKEEEDREIYVKLSVTPVIKRGI